MNVSELIALFESVAPIQYQESYDNSGLQIGNVNAEISGAILSLDVTEGVIDEAIEKKCNLIIAHHPLLFSGIKKIIGENYVQRIVHKAIKNDINIFVAHTNLDNMLDGVNARIASKLGLVKTSILSPTSGNIYKLQVYVPEANSEALANAMFAAGAGSIGNYSECSFSTIGQGTFKGNTHTQPFIGKPGGAKEKVAEIKIEVIVPAHLRSNVYKALIAAHPYEEVAFDWFLLANKNKQIGAGLIGDLENAISEVDFLQILKSNMKAKVVRHTKLLGQPISKIAVCGGSGSFLLQDAIAAGADAFVSSDFKYHQFFDADAQIIIADIGHYETEQFTLEIFDEILKEKNVSFAAHLSTLDTNPIKYF